MGVRGKLLLFLSGVLIGMLLFQLGYVFIFPVAITPVFSPEDGYDVISFIDGAEKSLDIEMYVFTSEQVMDSLQRAKDRGVEIRIIIEKRVIGGQNAGIYSELAARGFNVKYASYDYALTHSKFIIRDGKDVLIGSHNFSDSALFKNREASVILRHAPTVMKFMEIFETDWNL